MPQAYLVYPALLRAMWMLFVFCFGACIGSLINVLVYRLPLGIGVVTPPSRCPACETRLTWRENIPVLGWVLLRGRCRFCKSKISPEYPIVEAFVGLLFLLFYALYYIVPEHGGFAGIDLSLIRPEWARLDAMLDGWPRLSWPLFAMLLMLLGSLTAMTIVDAKTYTIPLALPWFATIVGLIVHPAFALWVQLTTGKPRFHVPAPGWAWVIPTPSQWWGVGAAIGGSVGLVVGMLLLRAGLIRRSFVDYEEWEAGVRAPNAVSGDGEGAAGERNSTPADAPDGVRGESVTPERGLARASGSSKAGPEASGPDMWIQYPHARREMLKELIFLSPCIILAYAGARIAEAIARNAWPTGPLPRPGLAVEVLAGVLLGYLIGAGVVWAVRIFGSLGFGKEAMGLGDVHLMGAVGACLGWRDAVIAFFGAAFVGIVCTIAGRIFSGKLVRAMPYGPYLAVSTVLVLLCRPLIDRGMGLLFP